MKHISEGYDDVQSAFSSPGFGREIITTINNNKPSVIDSIKKKKKKMQKEDSNGFRVKKEGPINFVFQGSKHVGNIIDPTLGSDDTKAQKFTVIAKHWGKKSLHDSKKSATEWLKNMHKNGLKTEEILREFETTHQNYKNPQGHIATLTKTRYGNDDTEITSHLPKEHKTAGLKVVRHSTTDKAHQRLTGLGYSKSGSEIKEDVVVGSTPYSRMQKNNKRSMVKVVKKDPGQSVNSDGFKNQLGEDMTDTDKETENSNKSAKPGKEIRLKKSKIGDSQDVLTFDPVIKDPPKEDQVSDAPKGKRTP